MDIIFENDFLIAVNKPAGMLSIPDRVQSEPSLKDLLVNKYKEIYTIHRLDKQTSGIILFAKDAQTHKIMSEKFRPDLHTVSHNPRPNNRTPGFF